MSKILVIAEIGVNHNGNLITAKKLIKVAKNSGADFVKFQLFITEDHLTENAKQADYQKKNLGKKISQYDMVKKYELSKNELKILFNYSKKLKIKFLASCFDIKSLKIYENFIPSYIKIPSGEITNKPLLEKIAKKKRKIFLSTGMSTIKEIGEALKIFKRNNYNLNDIFILQCTSEYPCESKNVNLKVIPELKKFFKCKVGFSDHTIGEEASICSIGMGVSVIEKHITLNKNMVGPDHIASMEPDEFKLFIKKIRKAEQSLGNKIKKPSQVEKKHLLLVRKSVVANKFIKKGDFFNKDNVSCKRPGGGISPMKISKIFGCKAKKKFKKNEKIKI